MILLHFTVAVITLMSPGAGAADITVETKEFSGTGGGTYTTEDGRYTEKMEFFSRDDTRSGMSLEFGYDLVDGAWHHDGKNSRGEPRFEIWAQRVKLGI